MSIRRSPRGFTVVEILVAVTITVVLAAVVVTVTSSTLNLWRKGQDNFSADTVAQLIFGQLERDLQSAIFRADTNVWLACGTFDNELSAHGWVTASPMKPAVGIFVPEETSPTISDARFSRSGHWLRLFATTTATSTETAMPNVVSYQIVRRSPASGATNDDESIRYGLYRTKRSSADTFAGGYTIGDHEAAIMAPSSLDLLGTNVVDFGVWLYRTPPDGISTRIFPASGTELSYMVASPDQAPTYADVMVRILSEEGAAIVSAFERGLTTPPADFQGTADDWWWKLVVTHSRVYVRRLRIKTETL
ncbi:MAG TPA: prepilin-type N-terminal cleavage/methylation domain-containing protein [Opitutus sp.]|nr:prepilin-type N-terminal cleavage/methylation domain-containing protein [Opitutus sp.]